MLCFVRSHPLADNQLACWFLRAINRFNKSHVPYYSIQRWRGMHKKTHNRSVLKPTDYLPKFFSRICRLQRVTMEQFQHRHKTEFHVVLFFSIAALETLEQCVRYTCWLSFPLAGSPGMRDSNHHKEKTTGVCLPRWSLSMWMVGCQSSDTWACKSYVDWFLLKMSSIRATLVLLVSPYTLSPNANCRLSSASVACQVKMRFTQVYLAHTTGCRLEPLL